MRESQNWLKYQVILPIEGPSIYLFIFLLYFIVFYFYFNEQLTVLSLSLGFQMIVAISVNSRGLS